ncbi:hypothetical protein QBC39DRAFT_355939 [Podospora conica]|nr:hypothetical protein QBC39DRAFT_355939 [Schizothecium conicum]
MDEFSDDGFDDLDDEVLDQLEENAIQATQAQRPVQSQAPASQFARAAAAPPQFEDYSFDDDLDDTVVINESEAQRPGPPIDRSQPTTQHRPAVPYAGQPRWNQHLTHQQLQPAPTGPRPPAYPPRSQYPVPARPNNAPGPSQRYPPGPASQRLPPQSQFARPPLPPGSRAFPPQSQAQLAGGGQHGIVSALQARMSALEAELTASKGEAAILRSKYEKAQIKHESEVDRLKRQNAEAVAKQERAVEEAMAAGRSAATELQFTRQDLREERGRAKLRKTETKSTTPKKNRTWGLADGFDGVEISVSPSKAQGQRRKDTAPGVIPLTERTPTKGKRKRPAVDSPTFALETHSGDSLFGTNGAAPEEALARPGAVTLPYDFLRLALDHSPFHGQSLTFDLFARFSFPSQPRQTISSIIFQKLPLMGSPQEPLRLLVDFAELMIELWARCLAEQYQAPIYYLASLVSYVLELNAVVVAPHIISSLIPVCITTCRMVALPRFNNNEDGDLTQHPSPFVRQLYLDGNVAHALSLLYLASLGCHFAVKEEAGMDLPVDGSPRTQFWKTVDMEFVVIMLSTKHPEAEWVGTISLLWTSIFPTSIGPIPSTTSPALPEDPSMQRETPELIASAVIERVSACMFELPRWAPRDSYKELQVRLLVLKTLVLMSTSPFGVVQIAECDIAIQRVSTVLCWAVDQLHQMDDAPARLQDARGSGGGEKQKPPRSREVGVSTRGVPLIEDPDTLAATVPFDEDLGHDTCVMLSRIVSKAILLLHTLVTHPSTADIANLIGRLAPSCGGPQRYLLTLARLAFADEGLVLDAGIGIETMDMAHFLLEQAATPEDTEGISDLF